MEERKSQKKEIEKEARRLLKEEIPKQQVFETLVDKYKYSKDVADVIRNIPSFETVRRYGAWNNLLLFLLICIGLIAFFLTGPSFGIVWYGFLVYAVAKKLVRYYGWITLLAIFGTLFTIAAIFFSSRPFNIISVVLLVVVFLPSCFLPIWLEKRLCPEPTERKEMYTNADGEQRMRIVYEFDKEI